LGGENFWKRPPKLGAIKGGVFFEKRIEKRGKIATRRTTRPQGQMGEPVLELRRAETPLSLEKRKTGKTVHVVKRNYKAYSVSKKH